MICSCFFNVVKKRRICISDEKKNMSASYTCVCFRASDGEIEREREQVHAWILLVLGLALLCCLRSVMFLVTVAMPSQ